MRAITAALSIVGILAVGGSAAAQTFTAPVPGTVTGVDPAAMLLIGNPSTPPGQARRADLAALETLALNHGKQTRKQRESRDAWLWWSLAVAGSAAIVALVRARHRRPDAVD